MQGARRRPWWLPTGKPCNAADAPLLANPSDRADFPSCGVVASLLGTYPTSSAPPCPEGKSAAVAAT